MRHGTCLNDAEVFLLRLLLQQGPVRVDGFPNGASNERHAAVRQVQVGTSFRGKDFWRRFLLCAAESDSKTSLNNQFGKEKDNYDCALLSTL
jgi:hypothetical protein